jgi:hypothetical protein
MKSVLPLLICLGLSVPAFGQNVVLTEDFNLAVPPAGWSQVKVNTAAQGWIPSQDGRAWHEDEYGVGNVDDQLISPVMNLSGLSGVYAHFYTELYYANYLANHPNSVGNGETDIWVRVNGGAWTEVWTETRTQNGTDWVTADLSSVAGQNGVEMAIRFFGDFAHEQWVDVIQVDDDSANPVVPPPAYHLVNLPAQFRPLTQQTTMETFESYAGIVPNHMAVTSVDPVTGLPAPEGWCTIAGGTVVSYSGVRHLEMGLNPVASGGYHVKNALVMGLDATNFAGLTLDFWSANLGDELDDFDGVWISDDGTNWYHVLVTYSTVFFWVHTTVDLAPFASITQGPFYLMFAQTDDYGFATDDGIGIDNVRLISNGPAGPALSKTGSCPGLLTLDLANCSANGNVAMLVGGAGSSVQSNPNRPCFGLTLNVSSPIVAGVLHCNGAGAASYTFNGPPSLCGRTVQGVDLSSCVATNTITL